MKTKQLKRPYFLWDYNLTEEDVKRKLKEGDEYTRRWLIARILESAKFEDVWKYVSLKEILDIFPTLRLKKPVKEAWEEAFRAWGVRYEENNSHTTPAGIS